MYRIDIKTKQKRREENIELYWFKSTSWAGKGETDSPFDLSWKGDFQITLQPVNLPAQQQKDTWIWPAPPTHEYLLVWRTACLKEREKTSLIPAFLIKLTFNNLINTRLRGSVSPLRSTTFMFGLFQMWTDDLQVKLLMELTFTFFNLLKKLYKDFYFDRTLHVCQQVFMTVRESGHFLI